MMGYESFPMAIEENSPSTPKLTGGSKVHNCELTVMQTKPKRNTCSNIAPERGVDLI